MNEDTRKHDWLLIAMGATWLISMILCAVIVVPALLSLRSHQVRQDAVILGQQEGRKAAVVVSCGFQGAVIRGGRQALERGVLLVGDKLDHGRFIPGPLTKSLGSAFPGYPERVKLARAAADAYEDELVGSIIKTAHDNGLRATPYTVGPDGHRHLNCHAYAELAKAK